MVLPEKQGSLWTEGAGAWEELFEPQRVPLYEAILDSCGVHEGMHILDAGCGSGGLAQRATLRGATVSGFDVSDGMVALAQQKMPQGDFRVGGVDAPPFENSKFDIVIACDCLFFADDVVIAIEELGRVCKENATVAIIVWELPEKSGYSSYYAAIQAALPASPKNSPLALSGEGVLEELIEKAGLKMGEVLSIPLDYRFLNFEQLWQAAKKLGIMQNMIEAVGEERIRDAAYSGSLPSILPSGEVLIGHAYRVVTAHS